MKPFLFPVKTLLSVVLACSAGAALAEEHNRAAAAGSAGLVLTADTPWVVTSEEPEAVRRALEDVQADWYKVLGHPPVVLAEPPKSWPGPLVYLGSKVPWLKDLVQESFPGGESFVLKVQADASGRKSLVAAGADVRGAIYAAYALSEEILGVDPWYYWVDKEPAFRGRIELPARLEQRFGPPTFKYRGWFINNDEDLLAGYAPDPMRENVFSLEMWDRICETILRLRGNLLVPGTFTFPDERCQELAARRGLVLNMHHILVVGLNTFRWPKDVAFSYSKHPETMEQYWQTCIDAFKGREVVWTVGLRGQHDRPYWADEPGVTTPEARGALITRAIAKQVELIRQVQPHAPCIANLWMESVQLMQEGHLKLPDGVTLVWPDDGTGLIRDNGAVQAGQGIYYHTAMLSSRANQLSEMVNPGRIVSELGRFVRAGATNFFLVNVSDVRPVPLSTDCAMRLVWNAALFLSRTDWENMDAFLADWSRRQFGPQVASEVAAIYTQYFDIPYQRREQRLGENNVHRLLRELDKIASPLIKGDKPLDDGVRAQVRDALEFTGQNLAYVADLAGKAEVLAARVPDDRKPFYQAHVVTPARIHLHSLEMLEFCGQSLMAYADGDKTQAVVLMEKSLQASENLCAALRAAEYGKWSRWYVGERFVGLDSDRDRLRLLLAALRGESLPPIRAARGYPEMYQYQEPFLRNFPLLYPPQAPR